MPYGAGPGTGVARGNAHLQPVVLTELVFGVHFQAERIARPAEHRGAQQHRFRAVADGGPRHPPGQAVDRVAVGGFAQVKLVADPGHRVTAPVDAVGPGREQLACRAGWELVGLVARDHVFSLVDQFTQAGAELGDNGRIGPRADRVLAAGDRDHDWLAGAARIPGCAAVIMTPIVAARAAPGRTGLPAHRAGPTVPVPELIAPGGAAWGAGDRQPRRLLNDIRPSLICGRNS